MQVTKEMVEAGARDFFADDFDRYNYQQKGIILQKVGKMLSAALSAMWQPIETAPRDGTAFQARIPGHGQDNIIAWMDGLMNTNEEDCGSWYFVSEKKPPDCWTDGVCWEVNANLSPSVNPTHWMPLPPAPETK